MRSFKFFLPGLFLILAIALLCVGFAIERNQYVILITLFTISFLAYYFLVNNSLEKKEINLLLVGSIVLRLVLVFSTPILSDDYFRYIWDGQGTLMGINPYEFKPIDNIFSQELFNSLNSPNYYSVYPPFCQVVFLSSGFLGQGDIHSTTIFLKLFILCFEIGTILMLNDLVKITKTRRNNILLYALNPLVIAEFFCGLHMEAIMIFFVVAAIWLLARSDRPQTFIISSLCFALAICTKLWPIMLLPAFVKRMGWSRTFVYSIITGLIVLVLFIPFWHDNLISNFSESLSLYFNYFEFNASLFSVFKCTNYNWIDWSLPVLKGVALLALAYMFVKYDRSERSVFEVFMLVFFIYFLTASTVHPWYITPLIAFGLFSNWKFPYLWSYLIVFTYITYLTNNYVESTLVITVEYMILLGMFFYEIRFGKAHKVPSE